MPGQRHRTGWVHIATDGKNKAGVGPDVFFIKRKNTVFFSVLCTSRGWERGKTALFTIARLEIIFYSNISPGSWRNNLQKYLKYLI